MKNKRDLLAQKRRDKRDRLKPFLEEVRTNMEHSAVQTISVFGDSDVGVTPI